MWNPNALVFVIAVVASLQCAHSLDNGLGLTPPMGWNSWSHFGCNPTEKLAKEQADVMVKSGMAAAGYVYLNLDDCWMLPNRTKPWSDPTGRQIANPTTFPSGMKALGNVLHAKGLKFGLYTARCKFTCQKFAASFGHEKADAQQWAEWGVDYIKVDECYGGPDRIDGSCHDLDPSPTHRLSVMRDALNATGRPIFFSNEFPAAMENYPGDKYNSTWMVDKYGMQMPKLANMWRISQDIGAHWKSILNNLDLNEQWAHIAAPGSINDPDMLQVGNGMSPDEDLSHFSMWCMLAAPLLAGNDLRTMSAHTKAVLTAPELIAVDQDPLLVQATVAKRSPDNSWQVWHRPLRYDRRAVLLLNRGDVVQDITVDFADLGITGKALVRDLWLRENLGAHEGQFTAVAIPPHGSVTIALSNFTELVVLNV